MKRREQVLLGVCGVVVAGSVWFALSPGPTASKTNLLPLNQARAKTAESKSNVRKLTEEKLAVEPRVKARAYNKPSDQLVPVVVGNLQAAAEKAGIHLREVRPLRPKLVTDESDPNAVPQGTAGRSTRASNTTHEVLGARVPVEVRFRAPFQPNVVKFLYDLENPSGRMVIDKISITSADARFRTVEVSAQITVFTRSSAGTAGGESGDIINDGTTKG
jgi:hypothetical protein